MQKAGILCTNERALPRELCDEIFWIELCRSGVGVERIKRVDSTHRKLVLFLLGVLFVLPTLPVFAEPNSYRTENEMPQDFFNLQSYLFRCFNA